VTSLFAAEGLGNRADDDQRPAASSLARLREPAGKEAA